MCLPAPQRDMTAWAQQLITKFFKAREEKKEAEKTGNNSGSGDGQTERRLTSSQEEEKKGGGGSACKWGAKIFMDTWRLLRRVSVLLSAGSSQGQFGTWSLASSGFSPKWTETHFRKCGHTHKTTTLTRSGKTSWTWELPQPVGYTLLS